MGKMHIRETKERRSLRKVFNTVILAFAIVAFWRGSWGLMDEFLFPNNHRLSLWISLFLGIFILYLTKHLIDDLI